MDDEAGNSVTLDCGEGVELGTSASSATVFWIALPPVAMEKGFSLSVTNTDGGVFQKSTSKSRTITRNVYNTMGAVECEFNDPLRLKYSVIGGTETKLAADLEMYPIAGKANPLLFIDYGDGQTGTSATHTYAETGEYNVTMLFESPIMEIGDWAFASCPSLIGVNLPQGLKSIGEVSFSYCNLQGKLDIPENVELKERAFEFCGSLDSIIIRPNVTFTGLSQFGAVKANSIYLGCDIPDNSNPTQSIFFGCKVDVFTVGNTVKNLGSWAFYVNLIKSFEFESPSSLTTIGEAAFADSRELQILNLPSSVTSIKEKYTFDLCPKLEAINIKNSYFQSSDGVLYDIRKSPKLLRYPEGKKGESFKNTAVRALGACAFNGNPFLKSITLDLTSSIPFRAFYNDVNLSELNGCGMIYASNGSSIGEEAFALCKSIKEYTIPNAVDTIKKSAFQYAENLKSVYCLSSTPPVLEDELTYDGEYSTFGHNAPGRKFYVPIEAVEAYRSADGWKNYKDFIYGYDGNRQSIDLSSTGTANSYIVSEAGNYSFKAVKGNTTTTVGEVDYVDVQWESYGTDERPETGDLVDEVSYSDGNIYFTASDKKGNALIAALDEDGNILWSWHIWMTDTPEDQIYNNNAGTVMDRNLGATSAVPGNVGSLGLLYQWGRKDPFLGSSSIFPNGTIAASTAQWPEPAFAYNQEGTIEYATTHPTLFLKVPSLRFMNWDWYYTGSLSSDETRWMPGDNGKTMYDPCPAGYRVPDSGNNGLWAKALDFDGYFDVQDSSLRGVNFGSGQYTFGSDEMIWYPIVYGLDVNGVLETTPSTFYWSSSVDTGFLGLSISDSVMLSASKRPASACAVRCVKDLQQY